MFTLDFGHSAGEPGLCLGPYASFHIEGELLLASPGEQAVARHRDHHWEVGKQSFFRLDVGGPVRVRFEAAGEPPFLFGPFGHYSMADGIAYVDRQFFASYSGKSGRWHCTQLDRDWKGFSVVSGAP